MGCSEACRQQAAACQAEIEAWHAKWPGTCENCRGEGGKSYAGSFDYKAGVGEPPHFEPCECILNGTCPRCGKEFAFAEVEHETPCVYCGWYPGDGGEPEPYECDCWLQSEDEQPP